VNDNTNLKNLGLQNRILDDGIYDVTEIERIYCRFSTTNQIFPDDALRITEFCDKHGKSKVVVASPYETFGIFLFAVRPRRLTSKRQTGEVGHGANLLISNSPKEVLILAEND
jgi:hypothetical protein